MKMIKHLVIVTLSLLPVAAVSAQESIDTSSVDTTVIELDRTINVIGRRLIPETTRFPFEKDRFNQVLAEYGFGLISKGVFLAQDIQADGFKRDDITIVVDGERYHSACPNRMDSPLARSNSLEMSAIDLNKTSSNIYSGLGGAVAYHREPIASDRRIRAGLSQAAGATEASDLGFAVTARQHRLAGRYAVGSGYEDGDGGTFVERYGYREDYTYRLAEVSLTGQRADWKYRTEFTYTDDVMFPYLLMDERINRVFSGSVAYRGHKLYANHTEHVMDNGLRQSNMSMVTDATNTTVGLAGPNYEVYYRRWDAYNRIVTPMVWIDNHLMPDVRQFSGSVYHRATTRRITYWGRLGLSRFAMEDPDRVSFFALIHDDVSTTRTFLIGAAGAAVRTDLTPRLRARLTADLVADTPPAQSLYISVQKPMGKPTWVGNPGLSAPVRASVRAALDFKGVTLEASMAQVLNYVNMAAIAVDSRPYQTYENIDALLLSVGLRADRKYLKLASGYTRGKRGSGDTPLAEVPPLYVTYTITSPEIGDGTIYLRHSWNDAQTRVDVQQNETATASWHRLDAGLVYDLGSVRLSLDVENLFDELYTRHLAYLRNPFSSGARVYEPGRTLRFNLVLLTDGPRRP